MERARATWTDERLDDLAHHIVGGFDRLDTDIRELRTDVRELRTLMIQLSGATIAAILGTLVTLLAAG